MLFLTCSIINLFLIIAVLCTFSGFALTHVLSLEHTSQRSATVSRRIERFSVFPSRPLLVDFVQKQMRNANSRQNGQSFIKRCISSNSSIIGFNATEWQKRFLSKKEYSKKCMTWFPLWRRNDNRDYWEGVTGSYTSPKKLITQVKQI